ncbi:MAG: hypothetical protein ACE37H_08110 [Phycisphaeraceae bacterium]
MSNVLLIGLGVYLAACYLYGMVLLLRLMTTRTTIRPTSRAEPTELCRVARAELELDDAAADEQRLAA